VIFEKSFKIALMQFERIAFSVKKILKKERSKEEIYEMRNKKILMDKNNVPVNCNSKLQHHPGNALPST